MGDSYIPKYSPHGLTSFTLSELLYLRTNLLGVGESWFGVEGFEGKQPPVMRYNWGIGDQDIRRTVGTWPWRGAPGGIKDKLYKIADIYSFWLTKMSVSVVQPKEGIWKFGLFWNFASDYPRLHLHTYSTPLLFYPNTLMKAKNDFGQILIFKLLILPIDIKPLYGFFFFFFKLAFSVCFGMLVGYLASMGYVFITCILQ